MKLNTLNVPASWLPLVCVFGLSWELTAVIAQAPKSVRIAESGEQPTAGKPVLLPASFEHERIFVVPETIDGRRLKFFTDTGGAAGVFADSLSDATELRFKPEARIPPPSIGGGRVAVWDRPPQQPPAKDVDGMLGASWFAGRTWTFDYPGKKLWWRAHGDLPSHDPKDRAPVGLKMSEGEQLAFPRIAIRIDGRDLSVLLDTGGTIVLSEAGAAAFGRSAGDEQSASFITATIFDQWRKEHVDWRVIENADTLFSAPIIQVPSVEIAGKQTGPAWFTRREDKTFVESMNPWMDKPIEGAIGGNVLSHFVLTVDYTTGIAIFQKP